MRQGYFLTSADLADYYFNALPGEGEAKCTRLGEGHGTRMPRSTWGSNTTTSLPQAKGEKIASGVGGMMADDLRPLLGAREGAGWPRF